MAKDPAFLFYPGDYLGGTMGWNFERHGVYLIMLIYQFNNGHFKLEDAISICGTKFEEIKHKFILDENGFYYNARLEEESVKRSKYSESRRINIKKRYNKSTYVEHVNNTCSTSVVHMENEDENKDRDLIENEIKEKKEKWRPPDYLIDVWKFFEEHRNKIKKPMTDRARDNIVSKLNELSKNKLDHVKIIDQSIDNGYAGIFPLKQSNAGFGAQNRNVANNGNGNNAVTPTSKYSGLDDGF
jgi:uncharacterized protein YdaU (DUF1376 family)